jgi:hypothetical protein
MRYFALFLMLLSLSVFAVGCAESPAPAPTTPPAAGEAGEDVEGEEVDVEVDATEPEAPAEPEEPAEPEVE